MLASLAQNAGMVIARFTSQKLGAFTEKDMTFNDPEGIMSTAAVFSGPAD